MERLVGMRLFDLLLKVRFLFLGQVHEKDTRPVTVSILPAPGEHAELLAAHLFLETDQTVLDRFDRLDSHADYAEINDPDSVFRPRKPVERDDFQERSAFRNDEIPWYASFIVCNWLRHESESLRRKVDVLYSKKFPGWEENNSHPEIGHFYFGMNAAFLLGLTTPIKMLAFSSGL